MGFRSFSIVYFVALAAEVYALATGSAMVEFVAKPLLMPILIANSGLSLRSERLTRTAIIGALVFSWFGDVFLLIDKHTGGMFVYGLAAFLAAHVAYIWFFLRVRRINRAEKLPNALIFVVIAFYSSALFTFLLPFVGEMLVPVAVYAIALSAMLATSVAAFRFREQDFGRLCVAGTLLFVVSDSILAISRFAFPFPTAPILVMVTYGAAQFLISEGARRNLVWSSAFRRQKP
jgi:uncharacterized membrane protein YhhN